MYIIFGILFIIVGILMIKFPKEIFELQKWKVHRDSSPSKLFVFNIRFGGIVFFLVGVAISYYSLMA